MTEVDFYGKKYISNYWFNPTKVLSNLKNKINDELKEFNVVVTGIQKKAEQRAFRWSWRFIILFGVFILLWMLGKIYILYNKRFDSHPFI